MQSISVKRYADPKATGWAGYLEPEDRSWIAFIDLGGRPIFFLNRDPVTGAIIGDVPSERESDMAYVAETAAAGGALTGMAVTSSMHADPDGVNGTTGVGERVPPLGVTRSD